MCGATFEYSPRTTKITPPRVSVFYMDRENTYSGAMRSEADCRRGWSRCTRGIETSHYPCNNRIGRLNADNQLAVVGGQTTKRWTHSRSPIERHNVGTSCDRACCRLRYVKVPGMAGPELTQSNEHSSYFFSVTLEFVIHRSSHAHSSPQIIPRLPTPLPKSPYLTYNVCIVYLNVISLSWWGVGPVVRAVGVHVRSVRIRH